MKKLILSAILVISTVSLSQAQRVRVVTRTVVPVRRVVTVAPRPAAVVVARPVVVAAPVTVVRRPLRRTVIVR